jgi:5'-nucleotidase / UDP-sugar diphosphatase
VGKPWAWFALVALVACGRKPSGEPAEKPIEVPHARAEVTVLFTSDEHGWLLAHDEKGQTLGGAAELLGRWVRDEHCPGAAGHDGEAREPPQTPPDHDGGPPGPACADLRTLALSGGDNFTGPAISSYFDGVPMAEAMARMGYAASAFGNHELDFGHARFVENRGRSGVVYLAANLHASSAMKDMALPSFAVFERRGIRIGVVGLATDTTLHAAMASRFEGITFEAEEPALGRAVRDAWAAGADVVLAIAHECPDVLVPIVARHPEWKLAFVGAGHCHKKMVERAGAVPVISPGWRMDRYLRVRIEADPGRPAGDRVIALEPTLVEMSWAEGAAPPAPPDPEIARALAGWKAKVDAALGAEIGWVGVELPMQSAELGRWITDAWRAELGVEVAIVNRRGLRQGLPQGAITKASVWSVLPFDNDIVLLRMKGGALAQSLAEDDVVAGGAARDGAGWKVAGAPLDPARVHSVATIDFLYYGGHFGLKSAASAEDRGIDWRAPVIAWTQKQRSSKDAPLERLLR